MPLQKIVIPPGVNRDLTQYALEGGGWFDTDKVRFRQGMPEKMGGWEKFLSDQLDGVPRSMHVWRTLDGIILIAIATETKVYVIRNSELLDVTPVRKTTTGATIYATFPNTTLRITDSDHKAHVGDNITISGAETTHGILAGSINGEQTITNIVSGNIYDIDCGDDADNTGYITGDIGIEYQTNIGVSDDYYAQGWGVCGWGDGQWNEERYCDDILIPCRIWSLDNWGEDLIINPWGGAVYVWDASNPNSRAVHIPEAPSRVNFVAVTDNRHLACFGCNYSAASAQYAPTNIDPDVLDTLRIEWCSQEDYSDWDIGDRENTAGDYRITGGSQILAAAKADTVMLVWTEESAHLMQAVDPPLVFRFDQIGTSTGIISPNAWAVHNGAVFWMGDSAFYTYQGGVGPLVCPVEEYLFSNMDFARRRKVFAALDRRNDEVMWFYPTETVEATCLCAGAVSTDTELSVLTTAGFPATGHLLVGNDQVSYSGKTDSTFTGCTLTADYDTDTEVSAVFPATTSMEPARYVTYSLKDNVWWIGRMERTAWADRGMIEYPVATSPAGYIYQHEYGVDADGEALPSYLESCDFDIDEGDRLMFIKRLVPDFAMVGSLEVKLRARYFPQSAKIEEIIGDVTPTTEFINSRIRGREASFTVKSIDIGDNWRLGACRLEVQQDGGKR